MGELTVLIKLLKETPLQTILIVAGIIFLFLAIFSGLSKRISVSIFRQKLAGALGGTFLALGMLIYFVPGIKPGGQAMTTANTTEMPTNNNTIKTPATNSNYNLSKSHSTTSNNTISSTTENNWPKLSEKIREKETTKNSLDQWPLLANFNFTIENSQRWFVGTKTHGIGDRTQSFHDGRYRWDMEFEKRGYFWYRAPVPSVQDFSYSIDARLTDSPAYKSSYGMAFRISGKKFYAFLLADNRQFTISLFDSGDMKTLQPWTKTDAIYPRAINRLHVIAKGGLFYFYINNKYVAKLVHHKLKTGTVGMVVQNYSPNPINVVVDFDNLQLRKK